MKGRTRLSAGSLEVVGGGESGHNSCPAVIHNKIIIIEMIVI